MAYTCISEYIMLNRVGVHIHNVMIVMRIIITMLVIFLKIS